MIGVDRVQHGRSQKTGQLVIQIARRFDQTDKRGMFRSGASCREGKLRLFQRIGSVRNGGKQKKEEKV